MKLKARLEEVIADLEANPNIEVVDYSRKDMTTEKLEKLEAKYDFSLPEELKALLLEVGSVSVKWRSWADPDIWGEVQLNASNYVKKILVCKDLFYLPAKGHFAAIGPMAKPDSTKARKTTRKLTESFEEAFELMLNARGFHGWTQAYFGKWTGENSEAKRSNPRPGLFQAALPALFDDFDLNAFGDAAKIPPATDLVPLEESAFDLSPEQAGLSFAARLQRRIGIVDQNSVTRFFDVKFNPPVTQEEIDTVQEAMDFELSESFLNYFRSCNGFQFSLVDVEFSQAEDEVSDEKLRELWKTYCESGGRYGSVEVPTLKEIFTEKAMPPMDGLGDEGRFFGYIDSPLPDGHSSNTWHMLAVDFELTRANPNPILRLTSDYGADLDSHLPVDGITYLEWLLISMGNYNDHKDLFKAMGATVNEPIRQATAKELDYFTHPNDLLGFTGDRYLNDEFWDK